VEMCGEPLTWSDVRPFVQKFERLDASGNGAQLCRHEPRRARPTRTHPLVARSFSFLGSRPNLVTPYYACFGPCISGRLEKDELEQFAQLEDTHRAALKEEHPLKSFFEIRNRSKKKVANKLARAMSARNVIIQMQEQTASASASSTAH